MASRFIADGADDAYASVAMEEAILAHNDGLTVRVWNNERSVIIGRAQLACYETDVGYCAAEGIPIVRRITAGGAVFNGPGNLNWSLFIGREFSRGSIRYVWGVREIFRMSASLVTRAIELCGVRAWLLEPNRIVSSEGKICGMAAYVSRTGLLCHGTLLLDADLEEARRLTEPVRVDLERQYTRSNPAKMSNIGIGAVSFMNSLKGVVAQETGAELETSQPGEEEIKSMSRLLQRYRTPEWNLGDPFMVRMQ